MFITITWISSYKIPIFGALNTDHDSMSDVELVYTYTLKNNYSQGEGTLVQSRIQNDISRTSAIVFAYSTKVSDAVEPGPISTVFLP